MQGFAQQKPHGYAGDFEIIQRIYARYVSKRPSLENWDLFFHSGEAPAAVRNRGEMFGNLINSYRPASILSVGCGPALDVLPSLQRGHLPRQIHLLDNDKKAIECARSNLAGFREHPVEFLYFFKNALRFRRLRQYDMIWSSGLFDYLNEKTAIFLLSRLRAMLAPNGRVILGNFSHVNPSRPYMEIVGEWFLIHRDEQDLRHMAKAAGFSEERISVTSDATGVNLFLIASNG
jgi:extracellular factor (EF) 3-hydroxypalmitic acid methyl ester biosynthesis protein